LALYPEEQDKLYEHIKLTIGNRKPSYEDMPSLTRVLACFYETLRLFPPVIILPRVAEADTTLIVSSCNDENLKIKIFIPKGTEVIMDAPGLHYNPQYWPDPSTFKPERFLGAWNKDAFMPFSLGPRSCIGRKFGETEGVAVLTTLLTSYKVELKEEPQFSNETRDERFERILKSSAAVTLTPERIPLVFKKRV